MYECFWSLLSGIRLSKRIVVACAVLVIYYNIIACCQCSPEKQNIYWFSLATCFCYKSDFVSRIYVPTWSKKKGSTAVSCAIWVLPQKVSRLAHRFLSSISFSLITHSFLVFSSWILVKLRFCFLYECFWSTVPGNELNNQEDNIVSCVLLVLLQRHLANDRKKKK